MGHHDFLNPLLGFPVSTFVVETGQRPHHGLAHRGYRRTTRPGAEQVAMQWADFRQNSSQVEILR